MGHHHRSNHGPSFCSCKASSDPEPGHVVTRKKLCVVKILLDLPRQLEKQGCRHLYLVTSYTAVSRPDCSQLSSTFRSSSNTLQIDPRHKHIKASRHRSPPPVGPVLVSARTGGARSKVIRSASTRAQTATNETHLASNVPPPHHGDTTPISRAELADLLFLLGSERLCQVSFHPYELV